VVEVVVFGAGGRAGRRVVAEAVARGHRVTAVVRDPDKHASLAREGVSVVAGDVTDPVSVAQICAGHDAVVQAAWQAELAPVEFFGGAARALVEGLGQAGAQRLVVVGIGVLLRTGGGERLLDTPGFDAAARDFSQGHVAELEVLENAASEVDWVVLAPPPAVLDDEAERPRENGYRAGDETLLPDVEGAAPFSYADLAAAVVDEVESPKHHRVLVAIN
jgi:putative NADH-flavin reductase